MRRMSKAIGIVLLIHGSWGLYKGTTQQTAIIQEYLSRQETVTKETINEARRYSSEAIGDLPLMFSSAMMAAGAYLVTSRGKRKEK